ncbi:C4-dicarboxylate ABC transporter permease [Phyllobacterium phragmitis]|uniref:C4-dicarboxylate ABC transporter permease n=1 Tax=Phyllobacterium phragmitis TaxID=2670329 RepID=A0A2S9IQW0_9HYPH|nr:tripartite tricarboxylate transporter TctB family protein [Phyllobacterium phragmitis]PRD42892.1 C4-dicarboxylate ABC transporter permease [Phyllobacterium phragmitis]
MQRIGSDVAVGCGLLAFSAFAAWRSLGIRGQSAGTIAGPSFLPWLMIGAIIILSLMLVLRARRAAAAASAEAGSRPAPVDHGGGMKRRDLLRIALFAAMLVAYSAAFMPLGYLPATLIVFIAGMLLMGERSPLKFFVLPVLITGAVWFGFTRFLQVWLP